MKKFIFSIFLINAMLSAEEIKSIIQKSDALIRGNTCFGEFTMQVKTPRWTRTIKMQNWSKGTNKSFIKILYPIRDQGTTFLKIDNEMWQYVPKVEKTIKIPPSMMLQSWMGSDFTNDDLVKESSIVNDYQAKLLAEESNNYKIELIPNPDAAVTWGKIIIWIQKETYVPLKEEFYDEENLLVRVLTFQNIKQLKDRCFPYTWVMESKNPDKAGNITTITVSKIEFDQPLPPNIFSLQSLQLFAK